MNACADYAEEYYGDPASMRASIIARAEFENEPLDRLYYKTLYEELDPGDRPLPIDQRSGGRARSDRRPASRFAAPR